MARNKFPLIGLTLWLVSSCSQAPHIEKGHPVVSAYVAANNAKDIEAMGALMHPDIEWVSVNGDTLDIAAQGKQNLIEEMTSYFENPNMATGSLRDWSVNGNFIAVTETASWQNDSGETKSQSALSVYELDNNLVKRVYYYPAVQP